MRSKVKGQSVLQSNIVQKQRERDRQKEEKKREREKEKGKPCLPQSRVSQVLLQHVHHVQNPKKQESVYEDQDD